MKPSRVDSPTDLAQTKESAWLLVFAAWIVATAGTLAALFFSEVMKLPPCVLCWYQRIFLFPLVLLLPLGLFPFDPKVTRYALPLAALGWVIALFHVLLTYGIVPEGVAPCSQGVPCAQNPIQWFGFLSIPLLSLAGFSAIAALLALARPKESR